MTSSHVPDRGVLPGHSPAPRGVPGWGLLTVLAGNMLIDALEVAVMVVALPAMRSDLGLPLSSAQWVITGFAAGFGGLLLFGNRLVALYGRRRVYLAALLGFAAASVLGGLAASPVLLLVSRLVKGFCAALTAPTGLAIILTSFGAGRERDRAISVYTLFGASGFSAGLVLSGWLSGASWRWVFLLPGAVVLVLFTMAVRFIPADLADSRPGRPLGAAGAALFTGALLALVQGVTAVPAHGWRDARCNGWLALAAVLSAAFAAVQVRGADPLVRFRRLADGTLLRSALGAAALNGSYLGLLLVLTVQLQEQQGRSPFETALALLPASVPLALSAPFSGRMVSRWGPAPLIALGSLAPALGYLWYLHRAGSSGYATAAMPALLLVALGFVLSFTALHVQATSGSGPDGQAEASGLYQTAVQCGAVVVPALVAAVLAAGGAGETGGGRPAMLLVTAVGLLGCVAGFTGLAQARRHDRRGNRAPGT